MRKFIFLFVLVTLYGCSGKLSDSEALKIAKETRGFVTAEYMLLRINENYAATPESSHIVDGIRVSERDKTDEEIHRFNPDNFILMKLKDEDGNLVNILGDKYTFEFNHRLNACAGCLYCYEAFAKKGLLTYSVINDVPDEFGFKRVDVKLTRKGKDYVISWKKPNSGHTFESEALNANTGDAVTVKLMQRVYTGAEKDYEDDESAEFILQYYYEMTPFGEALYGPTDKEAVYQAKAYFSKDSDGEWSLDKLEEINENGEKGEPRKF